MEKEPIFTISDVLPSDRLPRPLTEFDGDLGDLDKEDYETNKKYKEINFLFIDTFKKNFLGKDLKDKDIVWDIKREIEDEKKYNEVLQQIENKNIINRLSGTTGNNWIYSQQVNQLKNTTEKFVLYLKILNQEKFDKYKKEKDWEELTLFDLIKNIFQIWYGKKKSSGKWVLEIIEDWKESKLNNFNWKNIVLLSSFIPSKNDPTDGNYKIFTKFPKLWEEFSIEWQNFYKKPLVMIDKWATFLVNQNAWEWKKMSENKYKWYVWKMVKDSAVDRESIYHYGYWFTLEF